MAKPSKKDYLKRCRDRIDGSRRWRKNEGYDELWQRLVDLYRGKHFPKAVTAQDRIAINLAFSTINVIAPSISVNYPKVTVLARTPELEDNAEILEAAVNYWWRIYEFKPEFQRAVKDMLILGFGWMKTGYRFVEEAEQLPPEEMEGEFEELRAQADEYAIENPDLAGDLPTDEEIAASAPATRMRVVEDRPFVERVSPFDVFVDPEATSMHDCRWIAQRVIKDLEEVRKDERYKPKARKEVKPDHTLRDEARSKNLSDRDADAQRVTVWEYYDLRNGQMCVFADSGDEFLIDPMEQPYEFGHPFVMIRNYEVPDQFYPMGELEAIEDLQQELNKTRTQQMNFRKKYARTYVYDPRAFSKQAIGQLESGRDGAMVPVNEGVPLNEAVLPIQQIPIEPQIFMASEQIEGDINTISGISEYQRGATPEIRRTATEAAIIQDAANARAADKLANVEGVIALLARRLVQLAQQYMTEPMVVRLMGRQGPVFAEVEPEWIKGEFDFEVEAGSTQPQNETFRRQSALQLLQAMGPLMAPGGPLNTAELLRHVLQQGFGIKDPARFLNEEQALMDPQTGMPLGGPPPMEGEEEAPPGEEAGSEAMDPLLAQLQGQVGLNVG